MTETQLNELRTLHARLGELLAGIDPPSRKQTRESAGLVTRTDAARQAGVSVARLNAAIRRRDVPTPRRKVPGQRIACYSPADVAAVRAFFSADAQRQTPAERRRAAGYFSQKDVARRCGVGMVTIAFHVERGRIARPTHKWDGGGPARARFYSAAEADAIERVLRERKGFSHSGRPRGRWEPPAAAA